MQGKIIKGIAGFYYVKTKECVYECKAKGIFRKEKLKPLVGDDVEIDVLDYRDKEGNICRILPRHNQLVRPAVANVDQAIVIFALENPSPNHMLLDKFLISMEYQQIPVIICFNKSDLADEKAKAIYDVYSKCGYQVLFTSALEGQGVAELENLLKDKTSVVAGPSGVGKSSLTNALQDAVYMETGEISRKLGTGKHTTRHSQLIALSGNTFLVDTPGFSSLYVEIMDKEELRDYFIEFRHYEGRCRFQGCQHIHEPDCGVKAAVDAGVISRLRYDNYVVMYQELADKRRY